MFTVIILIILLLTVALVIFLTYKDEYMCSILCSIVGACFILFSIILYVKDDCPTALDVYQNKTTLKITYVDGVPVDSVVVFKEQFKEQFKDQKKR